METKDTLSSCSDSEEQQMQQILDKAKKSCMKSIDERAHHKREYDRRVNERHMQTIEEKVDTSKALDASLVDTKSSGIESVEQDTSSGSGNDAHADDADIIPIYDEEPMAEENETLKRHYKELSDSIKITRAKTKEHTNYLIAQNAEFKTQLQERGFAIAALKNKLRKLTGNSVNTEFVKSSILGKPVLQPHRNQSVVRHSTAFKSERPKISKPRFASQVDVNNDLSKPVTTHYLLKKRESAVVKPHHVIASSESRNSSKNMPRFSLIDMVHNHYLEEAKKKTQGSRRNSRPSVMPSARSQSTANEVNLCAKVPSNKMKNINKPVEQISVAKQPERQIPKGHRFSIKKTFVVHEKTMTPRSCLGWKPTGKIFKTIGLRWVPTGNIFTSSTTKVDSEPINGSNAYITNQYECEQTLNVSAGTFNLIAGTSFNPKKEGLRVWLLKRLISQKSGLQRILI
nr:hypothetical protein [Tanacetum cinerariifolium]